MLQEVTMRYFLKTVYEVKRGKNSLEKAIADVREILKENNLEEERQLFNILTENQSKSESNAPWNKIVKKYPNFQEYVGSLTHRSRYISNFPYCKDGTLHFYEDSLNNSEIEDIFSQYGSADAMLVLDNINFFGDSDFTPYWDGSIFRFSPEEYRPSEDVEVFHSFFIDNPFPQYCSNSIRIYSLNWLKTHEIAVVIEIRNHIEIEKAYEFLAKCEEKFGKPRKQYMPSCFSYDDLEEYQLKIKTSNSLVRQWIDDVKIKSLDMDSTGIKLQSVATQKKHFLSKYGYKRFPIKPWDDYGYSYHHEKQNFYEHFTICKQFQNFEFSLRGSNFCVDLWVEAMSHTDLTMMENLEEKEKAYIYFQKISFMIENFREEIVPKIVEIYGTSDDLFVLNSIPYCAGACTEFSDDTLWKP